MSQTKKEIRAKWDKEHLVYYTVILNREKDAALVDFIEQGKANGHSTSGILKGLLYKAKGE